MSIWVASLACTLHLHGHPCIANDATLYALDWEKFLLSKKMRY